MNVLQCLVQYCKKKLLDNEKYLQYFFDRGLTFEIIDKFNLGYFPSFLDEIFEICDGKELKKLGIVHNAVKSIFFNRVIFPIYNLNNEVVAIAGRRIDDLNTAKYVNSIYNKVQILYGLNFTKEEIRERDSVFVVEGYFDFLTAFAKGLKNIVAVCGTLLSLSHFILLSRYASNIYLLFDNDKAGEKMSMKIIKDFKRYQTNIKRLKLCDGVKDLDNFFQKYSLDDFYNFVYNINENLRVNFFQRLKGAF